MSLKLSLADAGDVKIGGFVQAFVCFSWSSAFQGFCESCRLTQIEVMLDGFVVTKGPLGSRKKFYSSQLLRVGEMYGQQTLGRVFPERSLTFPFPLSPGHHLVPSSDSAELGLTVYYRLKTRLVLTDPQQRSRDINNCTFTHVLPYHVATETPNSATLEAIHRFQLIPRRFISVSIGTGDAVSVLKASLSQHVVVSADILDVYITFTNNGSAGKHPSRITGQLVQKFNIEKGPTIKKKAELFNIRIDKRECNNECLELSVPFILPATLIPTMIEKDDENTISYYIQVTATRGKRDTFVSLPLIVIT